MPMPLGQIAYQAYCESRNWMAVNGDHLPPWDDQSPELKRAWDAAALAVEAHQSQGASATPASMSESQRYTALREILPFAKGATVDELIESQLALLIRGQQDMSGPAGTSCNHGHGPGDFSAEQERSLSSSGATTQQDPPGD